MNALKRWRGWVVSGCIAAMLPMGLASAQSDGASYRGPRQAESLDRGLIAIKTDSGVFLSWRLLGPESYDAGFHIYRDGKKLTRKPWTGSTNYLDPAGTANSIYTVRRLLDGREWPTAPFDSARVWGGSYLPIPLVKPADGVTPAGEAYSYRANDASVGDLDGDGDYEIVLKWDPSNQKDNSQSGYTGEVFVDAYEARRHSAMARLARSKHSRRRALHAVHGL